MANAFKISMVVLGMPHQGLEDTILGTVNDEPEHVLILEKEHIVGNLSLFDVSVA